MNSLDIVMACFMYAMLGNALWIICTAERIKDSDNPIGAPPVNLATITLPQLIALYLVCGPFLWVYAIWRLLGMRGKRKGSAPSNP